MRPRGFHNEIFIHRCTDPKSQQNVKVKIKCVYLNGTTKPLDDKVNLKKKEVKENGEIKTYGEADHATNAGKSPVDKAKTTVTITWK